MIESVDVPEGYNVLGRDADQGYIHAYRFSPEEAEILYLDDDGDAVDRWFLDHGDPKYAVQQYKQEHPWQEVNEIEDHGYRSLPDPRFDSEKNEALGGSLILDDGEYLVPFRSEFSDAAKILEDQVEGNDVFIDYTPDFIELAPEDALEKYQLSPALRGDNEITGSKIVDEVSVLDRGSEEVYSNFQVDELAEDYFVDQLSQMEMLDTELARLLISEDGEGYKNLRTVSWASTSDVDHLENKYGLDCHELFKELGEEEVYRNENSRDAGRLHLPERLKDEVEETDSGGENLEEESEQAGLTDFS